MQEAGRRRSETNPDRRIHRRINSKAKLSCNCFLGVTMANCSRLLKSPEEPSGKPAAVTEEEKAAGEKGKVQHTEKAEVAPPPQKQVTHVESSRGKKEELKKEPPHPPQTKVSQHAQYAVAHPQPQHHTERVEKAHIQQQAVHRSGSPASTTSRGREK